MKQIVDAIKQRWRGAFVSLHNDSGDAVWVIVRLGGPATVSVEFDHESHIITVHRGDQIFGDTLRFDDSADKIMEAVEAALAA